MLINLKKIGWLYLFFGWSLFATPIQVPYGRYGADKKNGNHPGHAPLITDVTFRSIADHIIDQDVQYFDPALVQLGDIIYLNLWYLEWFEEEVHDHIPFPYLLITCDVGDYQPHPKQQRLIYDPKLAAWFCRNIVFSYHPKIIQIPMGQNDRVFDEGPLFYLKEMVQQKPFLKTILLYMNFLPRVWGDRDKICRLFENEPYCFSRNRSGFENDFVPREIYFKELASSYFVLSPFGLETDCVRTWEALALGCIPIVEHTFLDPLFEDLPVVFVHKWTEINEDFLKKKYEMLKDRKTDKAFFGHWRQLIEERQSAVRKNYYVSSDLEATKFSDNDLTDLISILEGAPSSELIFLGFANIVHALQLASFSFLSKLYFFDPWFDLPTLPIFTTYVKDPILLFQLEKISPISFRDFDSMYPPFAKNHLSVFIDFSYYRNSLVRDRKLQNWRHSLFRDLEGLYQETSPESLICGNMIHNEYVQEVLEELAKKYSIQLLTKGNFWYFFKKSFP